MFKITVSQTALEYIYEQNSKPSVKDTHKLVVVIFEYSSSTWTMSFCGNVLELVEKYKVLEDKGQFILWTNIENNPGIEVYIEEKILPEIEEDDLVFIDAIIADIKGEKSAFLFIRKNKDVYG